MFSYFLYLLGCFALTAKGRLKTWPNNTEAIVGQAVRLSCSSSEPYFVNWEHVPRGSKSKVFVYIGGEVVTPYDSRFKVVRDEERGEYDLQIVSVQKQDSGKYRCIDMEGQGERREAELIVLGSTPVCFCEEIIGEDSCGIQKTDELQVTCRVTYSGNAVPFFSCPDMNEATSIEQELETESVKYVLDFKADLKVINYYQTCFTAISNIPSTKFKANITYVETQRRQVIINAPGNVTCSLNSSKECQYKWIRGDLNNEMVSTSQTFFVKDAGTYRCEVDCLVNGVSCMVQPVEIIFMNSKDNSKQDEPSFLTTAGIAVIIVIAVVAAAVGSVIYFIKCRKKLPCCDFEKHSERNHQKDVMLPR